MPPARVAAAQRLCLCFLAASLPANVAAPLISRSRSGARRPALALLAAAAALRPPALRASPCVNGLDYLDLIGGEYGLQANASNPRDCCAACGARPGCQYFAWVHAHAAVGPVLGVSAPPGCWLKLNTMMWTARSNVPRAGNRAPASAAAGAPAGPRMATPLAVGQEAAYVVVGGDCTAADSCNATLGVCEAAELNSTLSACTACTGGSIHAPAGGALGDCPADGNLADGQSCALTCPDGWFPLGQQPECQVGAVVGQKGGAYNITCQPCEECEGIYAPEHGSMGDCPADGKLPWNAGCHQRCDSNYIVVNTSHHPYCSCGAAGGPALTARTVQCQLCETCDDWALFLLVLVVGLPIGCCWLVWWFQLLPKKWRRKVKKVRKAARLPSRCRRKTAADDDKP